MKRSTRLKTILELTESQEKEAVQRLGQSRQKVETAQQNLNNLESFLGNYTQQFNEAGNKGLSMRQLTEYRSFLGKINAAIDEQEKTIQKAQTELLNRQTEWETANRKALGLQKVFEKAKQEDARMEEKAQQSEQDERASRRSVSSGKLSSI